MFLVLGGRRRGRQMEPELQKKKGYLDFLFYKQNNQRDFFVCGTYAPRKFTKWKTYLNAVANIDVLNLQNNKDRKSVV